MKIPFRQGLVNFARSGSNQPLFLKVSPSRGYIDLVATPTPVVVAFAQGKSNYILSEPANVPAAWGPLPAGKQWMFWDIDLLTAVRTFGFTSLVPIIGSSAVATLDQHWFDTTTTTMKVWNGRAWIPKIRVFAGTYDGSTLVPNNDGTQVGIRDAVAAGRIIFDATGHPVRKANNEFFTTEDNFLVKGGTTSTANLEQSIQTAQAQEPIPAYSVVKYTDVGQISLATYDDIGTAAIAMSTNSINTSDLGSLVFSGVVTNPYWNWNTINAPLWVYSSGEVSDLELDNTNKAPIGRVLSPTSILFSPYTIASGSGSSGTTQGVMGPTGPAGPPGAQGARGAPGVVDTAAIVAQVLSQIVIPTTTGSLSISGPDAITERSSTQYTVQLTLTGGTAQIVPLSIALSGADASVNSSNLVTASTISTQHTITLTASYLLNGTVLNASKTVTITKIAPVLLTVTGFTNTHPGDVLQLAAVVKYSDNVTKDVTATALYASSNVVGTIDHTGKFTAANVLVNTPITITTTYTENGTTVSTTSVAQILALAPTGMTINMVITSGTGTTTKLNELGTATFSAVVTLNNGTTQNVGPTWTVSNPAMGAISATAGTFTAASVTSDITGNITAAITYLGVPLSASKPLTIANVPTVIYPVYGTGAKTATINEALVLALPGHGTTANRLGTFTLDAGTATGTNLYMFYAYPVSYGLATFTDSSTNFQGGWDGAGGDPSNPALDGPVTISVIIGGIATPFYVYKTSRSGIGSKTWIVT